MMRWDEFKERRAEVFERYIELRKKILFAKTWLFHQALHSMMKHFTMKYHKQREYVIKQRKKRFAYLRTCLLFKIKLLRYGEFQLMDKFTNRIRHSLTMFGQMANCQEKEKKGHMYLEPRRILFKFINENVIWWIMTEKMKSCTRYFHKLVRFI